MTPSESQKAIDSLEETLRLIDEGQVSSTPVQRAYIAGTINVLRSSEDDGGAR